jgi:hypothetical protein
MAVSNSFLSTFFASNEDLITKILNDFLNVHDFCNLDTSVCNHKHRDSFLSSSIGYCFGGYESIPLGDAFLTWAWRRHVSLKKLCWRLDSLASFSILGDLCTNHAWNLTFLKVVRIWNILMSRYHEYPSPSMSMPLTSDKFRDIFEYSKRLEVLDAEGCWYMSDTAFDFIVRNCTNLKYINVENCQRVSLQAVVTLGARLPNLQIIHNATCGCPSCEHDSDFSGYSSEDSEYEDGMFNDNGMCRCPECQ